MFESSGEPRPHYRELYSRLLTIPPDELRQRDQAETLFDLGERTRRAGNLGKAYSLYQETHLTFPECYFGMKAIERMLKLSATQRLAGSTSKGGKPLALGMSKEAA